MLSIVTCSTGSPHPSVCSLPPFLPASDPHLPNARLGKALLLHHLESKTFTYKDTQLSRFNDLAAHPLYPTVQLRANGSHTPACRRTAASPLLNWRALPAIVLACQRVLPAPPLRLSQTLGLAQSNRGKIIRLLHP
jgi:hypothetical protein